MKKLAIVSIAVLLLAGAAWCDSFTVGTATAAYQMDCEKHACEICGAEFEVCDSKNYYPLPTP